jgi:hypothetical protein
VPSSTPRALPLCRPIPSCPDSDSDQGAGSVDAQAQAANSARVLASGQHPRLSTCVESVMPSEVRCFPLFYIFAANVVVSCEVQEITSLLHVLSSILSDKDISLRIQPNDKLNVQFIAKSISNLIVNLYVDKVFCNCLHYIFVF